LETAFGWRSIFHVFGLFGIVWSVVWWFMYRDRPEQHKRVNAAEADYIRGGAAAASGEKKKVKIPWKLILGSPSTWLWGFAWSAARSAAPRGTAAKPKKAKAAKITVAGNRYPDHLEQLTGR